LLNFEQKVEGTKGSAYFYNFVLPFAYHYITVTKDGQTRTEKDYGQGDSTYTYQLQAFADAVQRSLPFSSTAQDGILNMKVIDMIYTKAGLTPRGKFQAN